MHIPVASPALRVRGVHPYVRVYCAMALSLAIAFSSTPARLVALALIAVLIALCARVRVRALWPVGLSLVSLYAGLAALSVLSGMRLSEIRLPEFAEFAGRCGLIALVFCALLSTTEHAEIVRALEALRAPLLLVCVAGYVFRWIHIVRSEAVSANNARLLRGGDRRRRLSKFRDLAALSSSLMLRAVVRADRVAAAMECRGFSGRLMRPPREPVSPKDWLPLAWLVAAIALVWVVLP